MAQLYGVFAELDDECDDAAFERLCVATLGIVAKDPRYTEAALEKDAALGGAPRARRAFSALAADLARMDAGASQARSALEELGVSTPAKLDAFAAALASAKPQLRVVLGATTGVALPTLVDLEWRLDYVVRASDGSDAAVHVPVFYVKLYVAPPRARIGETATTQDDDPSSSSSSSGPRPASVASKADCDTIDLALSSEHMQDLLLTVRDANHQAGRLGKLGTLR